ncbi:putative amino-acid permease C15C4.04c [Exophiala dermatitidis]
MNSKEITQTEDYVDDNLAIGQRMRGTDADAHDMRAMDKVQQLNRNFRFISILGFSCTAMSTWEITLASSTFGLINGGLPGLVWAYFFVWIGYCTVFASIAELASMMPTAGGQYHWVSELSPKSTQKFLSYIVGWLSAIGWQAGYASIAFIAGTLIQGLIVLNDESYIFKRWHGILLVIAITPFSIVFNTFLAKHLPLVETFVLVLHILGFAGVLITLWVLAPRNSTDAVFTEFVNSGGWSSTGLSAMVGMLTAVYGMLGADSAVHMSEEIRDASIVLPRATMWALVINGGCGFVMMITYCFTMGNPFDALSSPTGFPMIAGFFYATKSHVGTSIMIAVVIINTTSSCISTVATVSRQLWSFARDGGLPYSEFTAVVRPGWNIPLNAVCLTFLFTALLWLINIGSTVAFNAICSMATNAMISTYIIAISCLVLRRVRGPAALPPRRWSLGKFGLPINVAALLFLTWIWVFCFFPQTTPATAKTMNWNIVIIAGIMILGVVCYLVGGGKEKYMALVVLVKRDA